MKKTDEFLQDEELLQELLNELQKLKSSSKQIGEARDAAISIVKVSDGLAKNMNKALLLNKQFSSEAKKNLEEFRVISENVRSNSEEASKKIDEIIQAIEDVQEEQENSIKRIDLVKEKLWESSILNRGLFIVTICLIVLSTIIIVLVK